MVFEREPEFELAGADGAGVGAVVDVPVPVGQDVRLKSGLVRGEPDRVEAGSDTAPCHSVRRALIGYSPSESHGRCIGPTAGEQGAAISLDFDALMSVS